MTGQERAISQQCHHPKQSLLQGTLLEFYENEYGEPTLQKEIHRQLVIASPGLRTLTWSDPSPRTTLETDDFSQLRSLKHLRILSDLFLPGDQHDSSLGENPTDTDINQHDGDQLALLGGLNSVRDLQEVAFLYPNTEQLSLQVGGRSPSLKEGLEYLRAQCPKIRGLCLKNYSLRDQPSVEIIESCSVAGLTSFDLSGLEATGAIVTRS
ncbi:hypothetical protein EC957_005945 [Mortierella hygrophila]|uniref:Uncharacterized protein n=1 Tax=Mortierella hygrophila TaxID=979708 RepID=A0A9P6K6I6_9FUNG|nr:hypothetical protein EC957_005945 [Mortierella hygrophila]